MSDLKIVKCIPVLDLTVSIEKHGMYEVLKLRYIDEERYNWDYYNDDPVFENKHYIMTKALQNRLSNIDLSNEVFLTCALLYYTHFDVLLYIVDNCNLLQKGNCK